jgi:hypothetical protein
VDGESYTQPVEIIKDPSSTGSEADIKSQVSLQLRIRDDINSASGMVNQIEWMRKQMDDVQKMLRADKSKAELLKSVQAMDEKMQGVEYKLVSKALTTSDDKYFIAAYKIYFNLIWLNGEVGTGAGDVAGGADYKPTDTAFSLTDMIEKDLAAAVGCGGRGESGIGSSFLLTGAGICLSSFSGTPSRASSNVFLTPCQKLLVSTSFMT